jgi:hypothetical protein
VEPRARADEHTSSEPVRAVVAVRRASVGVVAIVAVSANWRRAHVSVPWTETNPDNHSLCVRVRRTKHANCQQTKNS